MSIDRASERLPANLSADRAAESFNKLSLNDTDQSLPGSSNTSPHTKMLPDLPTEVWTSVAQYAFSPCSGPERNLDPYFADGQPDLTLMKVNSQLRHIFQKTILPSNLMILVQRRTCSHFPSVDVSNNHTPYTRFFASGESEPWTSISKAASVVSILVRCDNRDCRKHDVYTVATLYSPTNKANLLVLSQLITRRSWTNPGVPVLRISCKLGSFIGTQLASNFLGCFTRLIQPAFRGNLNNQNEDLFTTRRNGIAWSQRAIVYLSYFHEFQHSLDNGNALIENMIDTSVNFSENLRLAHRELEQPIDPQKLSAFIIKDTQKGCADSIVLEGLSEFMSRQPYGEGFQQYPALQRDAMDFIWDDILRRLNFLDLIWSRQAQNAFRPWQHEDLPFLVHSSAMLKAIIRFQAIVTVTSLYDKTSYDVMTKLLHHDWNGSESDTMLICLDNIRRNIDTLVAIDEQIGQHSGSEQSPELIEHDNLRIAAFVESLQQLTNDIQSHWEGRGPPLAELTNSFMRIGRERFRIPVVSDPKRLYGTFSCIHSARLLRTYYQTSS